MPFAPHFSSNGIVSASRWFQTNATGRPGFQKSRMSRKPRKSFKVAKTIFLAQQALAQSTRGSIIEIRKKVPMFLENTSEPVLAQQPSFSSNTLYGKLLYLRLQSHSELQLRTAGFPEFRAENNFPVLLETRLGCV